MYKIHLSEKADVKVVIHLNAVPSLRIPAEVQAGVGNKKERYLKYLDKAFKEKQQLLRDLANIHLLGLQKGDVALLSHPKQKDIHGVVIREWIKTNESFLDSVLIYLFPGQDIPKRAGQEQQAIPEDLKAQLGIQPEDAPKPQLTEDDVRQIKALMKAEEEKEELIHTQD